MAKKKQIMTVNCEEVQVLMRSGKECEHHG